MGRRGLRWPAQRGVDADRVGDFYMMLIGGTSIFSKTVSSALMEDLMDLI